MNKNLLVFVLLGAGSLVLALTNGCSSSDSSTPALPCNANPWSCAAGQVCWINDQVGSFACLNSDNTKSKGATCQNLIGQPTCGDGMMCFQLQGQNDGVCQPFCDNTDPSKGCATGESCATLLVGTSTVKVCRPAASPPDAGADAQQPDAAADVVNEVLDQDVTSEAAPEAAAEAAADATEPDASSD